MLVTYNLVEKALNCIVLPCPVPEDKRISIEFDLPELPNTSHFPQKSGALILLVKIRPCICRAWGSFRWLVPLVSMPGPASSPRSPGIDEETLVSLGFWATIFVVRKLRESYLPSFLRFGRRWRWQITSFVLKINELKFPRFILLQYSLIVFKKTLKNAFYSLAQVLQTIKARTKNEHGRTEEPMEKNMERNTWWTNVYKAGRCLKADYIPFLSDVRNGRQW